MRSVPKARLLLFALGDFGFNLYWQSIMLFLLFYYTDSLNLAIGIAATTYMVASVWDGIANFAAGHFVDREHDRFRYGPLLVAGAVPLGATFVLTYMPPLVSGAWAVAWVLGAHLLFRTAYAAVNVPYLAMSARISADTGDRAFVAGARMFFGTAALVIVALTTVPLGKLLTGSGASRAYFGAAMLFGAVGAAILIVVGATYHEETAASRRMPPNITRALVSLAGNRAFVALNCAIMAVIVAMTVLSKSVLYYFKYVLQVAHAGEVALAWMGIAGGIAIPLWMFLGRLVGLRALWLIAAGLGIAGLLAFIAVGLDSVVGMQAFLIGMQVVAVGFYFVFWAMLPNTIEYGERATGLHVEGTIFGVAALLQRVAIGVATGILGWSFGTAGYVANVQQSAATLTSMRFTVALVPLTFLALSCAAMLLNPLGRQSSESTEVARPAII